MASLGHVELRMLKADSTLHLGDLKLASLSQLVLACWCLRSNLARFKVAVEANESGDADLER